MTFSLLKNSAPLALLLLAGCASRPAPNNIHAVHAQDVTHPGIVATEGDDEKKVLAMMWDLPASKDKKVGSVIVNAEPPYRAASGRNCRDLVLTTKGESKARLACTDLLPGEEADEIPDEANAKWVFVPTVFTPPVENEHEAPAAQVEPPAVQANESASSKLETLDTPVAVDTPSARSKTTPVTAPQ